jgi:hypothetical protein
MRDFSFFFYFWHLTTAEEDMAGQHQLCSVNKAGHPVSSDAPASVRRMGRS